MLVAPLAMLGAGVIRPLFVDRQIIWTSIPFFVLAACALASIRPKPLLAGATVVLLVAGAWKLDRYYAMQDREVWRVIRLEANEGEIRCRERGDALGAGEQRSIRRLPAGAKSLAAFRRLGFPPRIPISLGVQESPSAGDAGGTGPDDAMVEEIGFADLIKAGGALSIAYAHECRGAAQAPISSGFQESCHQPESDDGKVMIERKCKRDSRTLHDGEASCVDG